MLAVLRADPEGTAAPLGIRPGDRIVSMNGHPIDDVIDYRFHVSEERLSLVVEGRGGKRRTLVLHKDPDDDLGLELEPFRIKRCRNRCIFCFVDQMPTGCRQSLRIKDDDYRASFLHGNYITLGNVSEQEWSRIFSQRLSPLYLSVHATEPELRRFILGNRNAPDIMTSLKRLAAGGIGMHTQIVLCRGVNDGPHLTRTITDLATLAPRVLSIAVVPAGVTRFRKGLYPLKTFSRTAARNVVQLVETLGRGYRKHLGTRLVYPSDEFYIKAGRQVPSPSFYEDFPQIENGVGMVAQFRDDARRARFPRKVAPTTLVLVTGTSFAHVFKTMTQKLSRIRGLTLRLVVVKNRFFGLSVTVAGLLTGRDIYHTLKGKRNGDLVLVPANALKEDEDLFLDGMTLAELEERLAVPVRKAADFREIAAMLREREER